MELSNLGQLLWRDPLQRDTDDLISEKFSMHRIHLIVLEYNCLVLVAILSATRPKNTVADLLMPAVVLKLSGMKEASLTSSAHTGAVCIVQGGCNRQGWKISCWMVCVGTLTSKNALW